MDHDLARQNFDEAVTATEPGLIPPPEPADMLRSRRPVGVAVATE